MNLHETSAALLTARRALNTAESVHAEAIAAEVRASVPGPWVCAPECGAWIDAVPYVRIDVTWDSVGGFVAGASLLYDPLRWARISEVHATPRAALEDLAARLRRSRSEHGRAALALVVRLLRGWA